MTSVSADIAVVGAGFGGSLTALIAKRIGLRPVLLERGSHPRFAIGESSTPLADLALSALADRYDLPRLKPLTQYGSWRRAYPEVMRGLKRGFSYFHHELGQPFVPSAEHANELLVAANPDDDRSDTHWLRADVDHFFVREVQTAGIPYFDRTAIEIEAQSPWRLVGRRDGEVIRIEVPFLVDASGDGQVVASALGIANHPNGIKTNSRAIYSHFVGVRRWRDLFVKAGGRTEDHPFDCDAAALHHIFDGGWMWLLRFDNDVVSAGFVLERDRYPLDEAVSPQTEWATWLRRFPSIAAQFEHAKAVLPLRRTGRLQRCATQIAGSDWAMLPHTAGFLDPLHSSGIALTLSGIERLVAILESEDDRADQLEVYQRGVQREVALMDQIIHGCYAAFDRFDLMATFSMYYFAGAIASEHRRRDGRHHVHDGFLMAHTDDFRDTVSRGYRRVCQLAQQGAVSSKEVAGFGEEVAAAIADYNYAGLCDLTKQNMYKYG